MKIVKSLEESWKGVSKTIKYEAKEKIFFSDFPEKDFSECY